MRKIASSLVFVALGVGILMLPCPWRLLFIFLLGAVLLMGVTARLQQQAIDMVRRSRHRYANQLQILSGWIQLGDVERASRYLDETVMPTFTQLNWRNVPQRWLFALLWMDAIGE
ncbi:MAG: Spo0B domain-containing protein, partial [Firmicutes bacterium]|nr:Spo0B domain-containing protein [Bacillota bacterium]